MPPRRRRRLLRSPLQTLVMLKADLDAPTRVDNRASPQAPAQCDLGERRRYLDAIESDGHDADRDVRRALVQRIEYTLGIVEQGEAASGARPQRTTGIVVSEPASTRVEIESPSVRAAVEPVAIAVAPLKPDVTTPPTVGDNLVAALPVSEAEAAPAPGVLLDNFIVPDTLAQDDPAVLQHTAVSTAAREVNSG